MRVKMHLDGNECGNEWIKVVIEITYFYRNEDGNGRS